MTNKFIIKTIVILSCFVSFACTSKKDTANLDTPTSGKIKIAVDESFRPIIDSELMVFQAIYGDAQIEPIYLPENKLFEQIGNDSVRLIISSRLFTEKEKKFYLDKKLFPKEVAIAKDAIALIMNRENPDSILSVDQIKQLLTGKISNWSNLNPKSKMGNVEIVFDNKNSGTVRYAKDSICKGEKLTDQITAMDINTEAVDYVSKHKGSIGFIGTSWISDKDDSTQMAFKKKIRVVYVSTEKIANYDNAYQPYPAYVFKGMYPFSRYMYTINTDPKNGLPSGFVSFLAGDKGQRIVLKFGIVPATAPTRVVNVRNNY
jgi:phosphate transport system substrate-binding protein